MKIDLFDELPEGWEWVLLGDVCEVLDKLRRPVEKSERKSGQYPYYGATGIVDYVDEYLFDEKLVLIGEDGAKWGSGEKTAFIVEGKFWVNNHAHVIKPDRRRIFDEMIVNLLNAMDLSIYISGTTVPKLNQERMRSIQIHLPPLPEQRRIADIIEKKLTSVEKLKKAAAEQQEAAGALAKVYLREVFEFDELPEGWE